jgi:hypothetical protein
VALAAFVLTVGGLTGAQRARLISLDSVAASPHKFAEGKYWLLLTNGLVADRPTALSLLALVLFGVAALAVCGSRVLWTSALVGHVGATVLVYYSIALVRLSHPNAFHDALGKPDIGVSAICAAWLGAIAAVGWRHARPSRAKRMWIVLGVATIGVIAWQVNSTLTILDADHGVAFVIGIAIAGARVRLPWPQRARQTATGPRTG